METGYGICGFETAEWAGQVNIGVRTTIWKFAAGRSNWMCCVASGIGTCIMDWYRINGLFKAGSWNCSERQWIKIEMKWRTE